MKKLYPSIFLVVIVISAIAATVKISDLPISTSPSTNTFIEIADMNAATKSSKYLLTNLARVSQVPTVPTMIVSNNVASAGLLSVDSTKTNGIAATSAHVIAALGYTPPTNSNWVADGTTNSTLAGNARVNAVVATNGITAGASTFTGASTYDLDTTDAKWKLSTRTGVSGTATVAMFESQSATKPMALDIMPGPGAGNVGGWIDICSTNVPTVSVPPLNTLRLSADANNGIIDTIAYGGASTGHLLIRRGSVTYLDLQAGILGVNQWSRFSTNIDFSTDNGSNLGIAGNAPKTIAVGTSIQYGRTKVLTDATATSAFYLSVPNTNALGGEVIWTVSATDGTETQQQTGRTQFGAVGKSTAVTADITTRTNLAQVSAGTLTVDVIKNVATNNVFALQFSADTSLTTTNLVLKWRLETPSSFTVNNL